MNPADNPFRTLGLPVSLNYTDDDIRAAWRRIAASTHPDREDGGDPAAYAQAANAYNILRTGWSRSETYADLRSGIIPAAVPDPVPPMPKTKITPALVWWLITRLPVRIIRGRPARLALRIVAAALAAFAVWLVHAGTPATAAVWTGIAIWLIRSGRHDLAPPGR